MSNTHFSLFSVILIMLTCMDSCTDNNFANTNVSNTNGTSRIKIL